MSETFEPSHARRRFASLDDFTEAVTGWMPRVELLEPGPFRAELGLLSMGPIRLRHSRVEQTLQTSGAVEPGMRSFGLPTTESAPAQWCGAPASARAVSVYESSGSFSAVTRGGFESFIFSVTEEALARAGEAFEATLPRPEAGITPCDPARLALVRRRLAEAEAEAAGAQPGAARRVLGDTFAYEVPGLLLEALMGRDTPSDALACERARVMRRAEAVMHDLSHEPLTVQDLCRLTGASRRTLQRAFLGRYGLGPKTVLTARRLNGVRIDLRSAEPPMTRIADIANAWGFWHMGQFAADYRRIFGELPSVTLTRAAGES